MMLKRPTACRLTALLVALALTTAACGDDGGSGPDSTALPLSVEGLLEAEPQGEVLVVGFVVADSGGSRLCSALAESFPPQCGGSAVKITGLDALDIQFEEAQGVRWTDLSVVVEGRYVDGTLTLERLG
jgi:hypothetical protein